ncbi:MAG: hypothetical protein WKF30_05720 [Pyrinomonadaceae bacterium]
MKKTAWTLLLLLLFLTHTHGRQQGLEEPAFDFYTRGPYRENVPRPQSILRFEVGEFHTNYSQMERVVERIWRSTTRLFFNSILFQPVF